MGWVHESDKGVTTRDEPFLPLYLPSLNPSRNALPEPDSG